MPSETGTTKCSRSDRGVPPILSLFAADPSRHPIAFPANPNPTQPDRSGDPNSLPVSLSRNPTTRRTAHQGPLRRCLRTAPHHGTTGTRHSYPSIRSLLGPPASQGPRPLAQQRPQKERERGQTRGAAPGFPQTPSSHTPVDPAHGRLCPAPPLRGAPSASYVPAAASSHACKTSLLVSFIGLRRRLCGHAVLLLLHLLVLGRRSQIHRARTLDGPGARPLAARRRDPTC